MIYSIGDFSKVIGLSIDTLRYYEKEELICPNRDGNNRRTYTDSDKTWVAFILKLKETAMPIKQIKRYAKLRYLGDETVEERLEMLYEHRVFMLDLKKKHDENIDHLNDKIAAFEGKLNKKCNKIKC